MGRLPERTPDRRRGRSRAHAPGPGGDPGRHLRRGVAGGGRRRLPPLPRHAPRGPRLGARARGPRAASDDALAPLRGEGGPRMTNANDPDVVRIFDTTL